MIYRLFALCYDLVLLFGVLFIITAILNVMLGPDTIQSSKIIFPISLLLICYFYFVWHWVRGGQTLGMKAWKLIVKTRNGAHLDWRIASKRFFLALITNSLFGLGLLWSLFDTNKNTLYDKLADTLLSRTG